VGWVRESVEVTVTSSTLFLMKSANSISPPFDFSLKTFAVEPLPAAAGIGAGGGGGPGGGGGGGGIVTACGRTSDEGVLVVE
jgi:hypothetical protein